MQTNAMVNNNNDYGHIVILSFSTDSRCGLDFNLDGCFQMCRSLESLPEIVDNTTEICVRMYSVCILCVSVSVCTYVCIFIRM